ncbi:MAG TPA: ABC transporter substrate-binding protein [Trebonia sp.]|nr:ABC transporter substrate-binding protein [Trebonia sp.]
MLTERLRRLAPLAVLTVAALTAAACSSSSSSSAPSSSSSGAGNTAAAAATTTLNVGVISNSVAFFPLYVARQEGYFADEHLNVPTPPVLGTGAKVAAALAGGSIDVAAGVITDAFNLAKTGNTPKVIAALVNSYYVDIVVAKNAKVAPANASLLTKIKSLKGLSIGITGPGSGTSALVTYLFKLAGMNPATDATEVSLGSNPIAVLEALKSGRVQALAFFQPIGQEAEAEGTGSIYISPSRGDIPALNGDVHGVIYTDTSSLASKKQAIEEFVAAIAKAEQFIHTSSAATVQSLLSKYEPTMKPATVSAMVPVLQREIPATPTISAAAYQIAANFHKTAGLVANPAPYADMIDSSLISSAVSLAGA